nr:DnaT-like ssDNA-binding protein [Photorhabdus sp. HUG-39]
MLTNAMDYLNNQKWKGQRTKIEQKLPFPRKGLVVDGYEISSDEIPRQLIHAQCRLAIEALDNELSPTIGGEVLSESVSGVVSITYAPGTNSGSPKFPWIKGLLSGILSTSDGMQFDVYRG